ncbi:MAG: LD-carboxypeptidase [Myxococcaceae bacterium]
MKILPIAISSPFKQNEYEAGKKILEARGHEFLSDAVIRKAPQTYLNGSDAERLSELESALNHQEADLIWAVRGGYGITRLLPDLSERQTGNGVIIGFSDVTSLTSHLWALNKQKSLHGPVLMKLPQEPPEVLDALDLIFKGQARQVKYPEFNAPLQAQPVSGIIIPANLSMFAELIGTSSMPNLRGSILMLEDTHEEPYQLDRMLTHLWVAGILTGVKAIIVGHLTQCGDQALNVFLERCGEFKIPCFTGFQMGHESPNWPLPIGVQAEIESKGGKACLNILEELF